MFFPRHTPNERIRMYFLASDSATAPEGVNQAGELSSPPRNQQLNMPLNFCQKTIYRRFTLREIALPEQVEVI